jgi:hypothetical protein
LTGQKGMDLVVESIGTLAEAGPGSLRGSGEQPRRFSTVAKRLVAIGASATKHSPTFRRARMILIRRASNTG